MKKTILLFALVLLVPTFALAANSTSTTGQNGNGAASTGSQSQTSTASSSTSSTGNDNSNSGSAGSVSSTNSTQNQNQVQTQTNNSSIGTMTQEQIQLRTEEQIQESKPEYSPKNAMAASRMSTVAAAVAELIRVSNKIENQGIGDQIRTFAQTQNQNQDRINQSIDKAETRTNFAKFFIGENYKELKIVKTTMLDNQNQIKELQTLIAQVSTDTDKLTIANQIMTLQDQNLALREQLDQTDDGFSLFGWINRWFNKY